jgi:hypothetical protein
MSMDLMLPQKLSHNFKYLSVDLCLLYVSLCNNYIGTYTEGHRDPQNIFESASLTCY